MLIPNNPPMALVLTHWAIETAFAAYVLFITGYVVLERRRPTATLALVLSLVFVPVVGMLAYVVFSRRSTRRIRRRSRRPIKPMDDTRRVATLHQAPTDLSEPGRGLVRLALKTSAAPLRRSDTVTLLPSASDAFAAFADAIASATRTIHCEFYIWRNDKTGQRITQMLTERAKAGIKVRVLYDNLGSLGLPSHHFSALQAAGGQVARFGHRRVPLGLGGLWINFRNHRKILTIDGNRGFLGSLNIGDEYLDPALDRIRWQDLAADLRGDAVIGLEAIFLEDWLTSTGEIIDLEGHLAPIPQRFDPRRPLPKDRPWQRRRARRARAKANTANPFTPAPEAPIESHGPLIQIVPSGPDLPHLSSISAQMTAAVASAIRRVWLTTPYFIPDEPLMLALRTAAFRGVDVRIMVPTPRYNDVRLVSWAARSYYDELLDAGARIFEYERGMLHSKFLIADDICAIGSANMDARSFYLNYEVTGMFYDAGVTNALTQIFSHDLAYTHEVNLEDRADPSFRTRLLESIARVLSPLL